VGPSRGSEPWARVGAGEEPRSVLATSGCISSQAGEGLPLCRKLQPLLRQLNPLTPAFLIKITLGVISRKESGWKAEARGRSGALHG